MALAITAGGKQNTLLRFGLMEQSSAPCRHVFKWTYLLIQRSVCWKSTHSICFNQCWIESD